MDDCFLSASLCPAHPSVYICLDLSPLSSRFLLPPLFDIPAVLPVPSLLPSLPRRERVVSRLARLEPLRRAPASLIYFSESRARRRALTGPSITFGNGDGWQTGQRTRRSYRTNKRPRRRNVPARANAPSQR